MRLILARWISGWWPISRHGHDSQFSGRVAELLSAVQLVAVRAGCVSLLFQDRGPLSYQLHAVTLTSSNLGTFYRYIIYA